MPFGGPRGVMGVVVAAVLASALLSTNVAAFQGSFPAVFLSPAVKTLNSHRPKDSIPECALPLRRGAARTVRQLITQPQVAAGSSDFDGTFEFGKVRIVGAVVERDGKFLMVERLKRSRGFFEFPGGKVEEGESDADALVRELKEELNVEGKVLSSEMLSEGEDGPVQLVCYRADITGEPNPATEAQLSYRWVDKTELASVAAPPADSAIIQALLAE